MGAGDHHDWLAEHEARRERRVRERQWWATAIGTGLVGAYLWFQDDVNRWVLRSPLFAVVLFAGGFVALLFFRYSPASRFPEGVRPLTSAALVVLVVFGARSVLDASRLEHYNCWTLQTRNEKSTVTEMVACAPGSEPRTGSTYNQWSGTGTYRYCTRERTTETGASVWACESGDI